jgi:hypothetical protein
MSVMAFSLSRTLLMSYRQLAPERRRIEPEN